MKGSFILKAVLLFALATAIFCPRAGAQIFGLRVTDLPDPVVTNATLTYSIFFTNLSGIGAQNFFVTNTLSASAPVVSASASQGTVTTNATGAVFDLGPVSFNFGAQMTLVVRPSAAGALINVISIATTFTNVVTTNISTTVTTGTAPPAQTDLGISIAGPVLPPLANDWMTYTVSVTNFGPGSVSGVFVTNFLPAGVGFVRVSPANQPFTTSAGRVVFNLGSLSNAVGRTFGLVVQPTNAGTFNFVSRIAATGLSDSNAGNNVASNAVTVSPFVTGQLVASNASAMVYNPQTGLMEQTIRLFNTGPSNVESARVIVLGLTNRLFNAVGTNNTTPVPNGNPFVALNAQLDSGASVDLRMEYFVPTRQAINVPDSAYVPVGAPGVNLAPPAGTPFAASITNLPSGAMLIEFASTSGRTYTILYSTNISFADELMAQPPVTAHADRVQWIDDGPPKTISHPTNTLPARFYRVLQNP